MWGSGLDVVMLETADGRSSEHNRGAHIGHVVISNCIH